MGLMQNIFVPDIGGTSGVDVIELLVKPGDRIEPETPLITLESDKATMEIPSPTGGIVSSLAIKIGDKVSEGDLILVLTADDSTSTVSEQSTTAESKPVSTDEKVETKPERATPPTIEEKPEIVELVPAPTSSNNELILAGPAARRLASSLGVDLESVAGTGRKSRVSKEDIERYVKQRLTDLSYGIAAPTNRPKPIDFAKFGDIERKPLSKIKRLTGVNVHQAWTSIPHVTQFDTADITDLDIFRQAESTRAEANGYKLTILAFVCKIVSQALLTFPQFNSSLDETGEQLIFKKYVHIGIAVETPNGLVVPVIKNVNLLSVADIAKEMARLSAKARDKGLMPAEMSGGCFTISSLGGIGGTAFTPIVNAPEVAILGLSRSSMQPVFQKGAFVPRLMLPLSLSYDHRVIDGAEAARFTRYLSESLADIRRILL